MEINLLDMYPVVDRDTKKRAESKTNEQIEIARKYGWEYFDKKGICYSGYTYDGRWIPIAKKFINHYNLDENSSILDVGCAKGYLMYDLKQIMPSIKVAGLDISQYAIDSSIPDIKQHITLGNAKNLSMYKDKEFDLVVSINTVHNLEEHECRQAIREIQRVGKKAFITMDSYKNDREKERIFEWVLTGKTIKSVEGWKKLFEEEGYTGDYYWFIP